MPKDIRTQSTLEKALDINLDKKKYGSFAEIGAGQEVARQFFQAGKASQTIALTISAYDMTYSDIIYGKEDSGRYVCESRVRKMLDREYTKLIDRLSQTRGDESEFFAFADTVATSSDPQKTSHGWMGVKFQHEPHAESSQIIIHLRLLDKRRLQQQETLSDFGVNLLHSAFFKRENKNLFIQSLFENIKDESMAIDALHIEGPAFSHFKELELNLLLVQENWAEAIYISPQGQVKNLSDALWGKSLLLQRAFYNPVTHTHLDVIKKGLIHFENEFKSQSTGTHSQNETLFEFTLENRIKNTKVQLDEALTKVHMINAIQKPVLVTNFALFYKLKEHLRKVTDQPIAMIIGASHLEKLFNSQFYFDLQGGLLEGMGKLVDTKTKLYIYPHKTDQLCLQVKSFFPHPEYTFLYKHFVENKLIQDIAGCDEIEKFIHSDDIHAWIRENNPEWKKYVPLEVQKFINPN